MKITRDETERVAIMVSPECRDRLKKLATDLHYKKDGMKGLVEDLSKLPLKMPLKKIEELLK